MTIPSPEIKWWDKVSAVYDQILKTFCFGKRSLEGYRYKVKHNNLFFGPLCPLPSPAFLILPPRPFLVQFAVQALAWLTQMNNMKTNSMIAKSERILW